MAETDTVAEELEAGLERLPSAEQLGADARDWYGLERRRIHRRYASWRATMPSLDALFDDDGHRGKALAGNLSTELEAALIAFGEALVRDDRAEVWTEEWLGRQVSDWRDVAAPAGRTFDWGDESVEIFDEFLFELTDRSAARANAAMEARMVRGPARSAGPLSRALGAVAGLLYSFFRPDRAAR